MITDAVSTQKWPGEAKIHVSLVNWIKSSRPASRFALDGADVSGITAELRAPDRSTGEVARLPANAGRCYQGPIPVGAGFIITVAEAEDLISNGGDRYRTVVRPFLTGDDIADDPQQRATRWTIDFAHMPLEEAARYPAALNIVREKVRPVRALNADRQFREIWWLFGRSRGKLRDAVAPLERHIVTARHGKRLLLSWCKLPTLASDATNIFAFHDDYSMGVLTALPHRVWTRSRGSTIKGDIRYTPSSVFETFPWPYPVTEEQRERVSEASRRMMARRQEICVENQFGLTALYNLVDDGAYTDLNLLHRELDEAVAAAYGWPKSIVQDTDEIVRRLLALNRSISAGERPYDPFGALAKGAEQLSLD